MAGIFFVLLQLLRFRMVLSFDYIDYPRIVGGMDVKSISEAPYMVSFYNNEGKIVCGGSIISSRVILTAGHCIYPADKKNVIVKAVAGDHIVGGKTAKNLGEIESLTAHPEFKYAVRASNNKSKYPSYDVGLVVLKNKIVFDSKKKFLSEITLPPATFEVSGQVGTVYGWGMLNDYNYDFPKNLKKVSIPIWSKDEFEKKLRIFNDVYDQQIMLIAGASGKDSCMADSGGPLVVISNKIPIIAGIVSFGFSRGCAMYEGAVYTKVSFFESWIRQELMKYQ